MGMKDLFKRKTYGEKESELKLLRAKNQSRASSRKLDRDLRAEKQKRFRNSKTGAAAREIKKSVLSFSEKQKEKNKKRYSSEKKEESISPLFR